MNTDSLLPPVPKLIFLTWKVRLIPQAVRRCVDSFKERNPAWTVVVMSDADCLAWLAARRPADLAWYEALPKGILRADAMRLLWLHEMGGVYADIDVECLRSLDGLVASLEAGKSLGLTRDHPVHERIHFSNTPMWMNDFMVARPGAPLIQEALRQLAGMVAGGYVFNARNAVMETGPGLLNRALRTLGGPEAASVQYLPWEQIHPLPDMTNAFPEKEAADADIRSRNWRGAAPWVAHYWYHTWCSTRNMVVAYSDCLFADREEAARERLDQYRGMLGQRGESVCTALERLAATEGPVTVIELGVTRSFIAEPAAGVDGTDPAHWQPGNPTAWDWGAGCFTRVAVKALAGYDFQYHGVDSSAKALAVARTLLAPLTGEAGETETRVELCAILGAAVLAWAGAKDMQSRVHLHEQTAEEFLASFEGTADLIYMDHGECSEETAQMHARDARTIIERGLVKEGGLVLIDDHGHEAEKGLVPKSRGSRAVFEEAGWSVLNEGLQLLLQRPYEVPEYIPRTLHVFGDSRRAAAYRPEIAAAWRELHPEWEVVSWDDERLRDFITADCPSFLETFVNYRSDRLRMAAGKFLVLKKHGGIAVEPEVMPLRNLDELLPGQALVLVARVSRDDPEFAGPELVHTAFIASSAEHPFWNGVEHDLKQGQGQSPSAATGSGFVTRRLRDGLRFLSPDGEWPELLDHTALAADAQTAEPDAWLASVPRATLAPASTDSQKPVTAAEISLAVMTVDRPQAYLHDTLPSLRREWTAGLPMLFPGSPASAFLERYRAKGFTIHETSEQDWEMIHLWNPHRKAMWNYWRCVSQAAVDKDGPCAGRLVFEDDVKFTTGWRGRFLKTLEELYAAHGPHFILSLYSPHDAVNQAWLETEQLAVPYATAAFMGTQGVYFPEPVRRDFAEYLRIYGVDDNLMPYDCLLGNYCEQCQVPLFATVPSLVQHVGVQTTGLSGGQAVGHTSPSFVEDVTWPILD